MGRHRAEPVDTDVDTDAGARTPKTARYELLGWGMFLAAISGTAMWIFAMPAPVVLLVAAVCLAAFVLLWLFVRLP